MPQLDESIKSGSTVIQLWRTLQDVVPQWADSAYSVDVARQMFVGPAHDPETEWQQNQPNRHTVSLSDESETTEDPTDDSVSSKTETGPTGRPTTDDAVRLEGSSEDDSGVQATSLSYRLVACLRRFVESSWLYRWLTAEPDAEVVVIDLRETLSAGPVIAWIDRRIRDAIAVLPTSGGIRSAFRIRSRFVRRPLRVLSIGLLAVIIGVFVLLAMSSDSVGLSTIILFGLLVLAARGTQSRRSLDELVETQWYGRLMDGLTLLEPPAPPEDSDKKAPKMPTEETHNDGNDR